MSKQVQIHCDHDGLYTAIELKLSCLPEVHVVRMGTDGASSAKRVPPADRADLIIVAALPPNGDPKPILRQTASLNRAGGVPVLVISEQPSRPESDDRISYLNFPFDMDDLTHTALALLERGSQVARHE